MPDTIPVTCPSCKKGLQVPAALAGKTIKCKDCQAAFKVPAAAPPPKKVKKAALAEPKGRHDEEDENANPYGVIRNDEEDIARCPHCAIALDPPDTKICLNCGYDLLNRNRHESKKVYAHTAADYIIYHFLTFVAILFIAALIGLIVVCFFFMSDLFTYLGMQSETENEITKKKEFWFPPGACSVPIVVFSLFGLASSGRFVFKRLFVNWRPPEVAKR